MKRIMKRVLTCMLALALVLAYMPAMPENQAIAMSGLENGTLTNGGTATYTNNPSAVMKSTIELNEKSILKIEMNGPSKVYIYDNSKTTNLSSDLRANSLTKYDAIYNASGESLELNAGKYILVTYEPGLGAVNISYKVSWSALVPETPEEPDTSIEKLVKKSSADLKYPSLMKADMTGTSKIYIYDSDSKLNEDIKNGALVQYAKTYNKNGSDVELAAGKYTFAAYEPGADPASISFTARFATKSTNTSISSAESIPCAYSSGATKDTPTQYKMSTVTGDNGEFGINGKRYWKFVVTDMAYFRVHGVADSNGNYDRDGSKLFYDIRVLDSHEDTLHYYDSNPNGSYGREYNDYILLDKGTYYISLQSYKWSKEDFILETYDYKDIKSISTSSVTVTAGKSVTLKYSASPSDFESKIYVNGKEYSNGDSIKVTYNTPGKKSVKIETSEGLTKTATVKVYPAAMSVKGVSSTGTHKSTTISWNPNASAYKDASGRYYSNQENANYYKVYQYKSGKYVKVWAGSKTTATITGLSASKTYSFKIAPCWKLSDGTIYEGPKSSTVHAITASSKAPKLKSAKASSTKYYPKKTKWIAGWSDPSGKWIDGYYQTTPAHSIASVKVSFTKVSGASGYDVYNATYAKNIAKYEIKGKVKAGKKQTVKIRAMKKSTKYNSVAYGPWSKSKTVKFKKAK